VTVAAGALTDAAGNAWAGLSGTAYTFVLADSTTPAVASYAPATGAAIVRTCSEAVRQRGGGAAIDGGRREQDAGTK
jgi:hypothetical protein